MSREVEFLLVYAHKDCSQTMFATDNNVLVAAMLRSKES